MLLFLTAGLGQLLQTYLLQTKGVLVHRPYVIFITLEELDAFPGKYLTTSKFLIILYLLLFPCPKALLKIMYFQEFQEKILTKIPV